MHIKTPMFTFLLSAMYGVPQTVRAQFQNFSVLFLLFNFSVIKSINENLFLKYEKLVTVSDKIKLWLLFPRNKEMLK